jgi:hypothetical protein
LVNARYIPSDEKLIPYSAVRLGSWYPVSFNKERINRNYDTTNGCALKIGNTRRAFDEGL